MAMINYPYASGAPNYNNSIVTPIIWVETEAEARGAYIAPGTTGFFMERQNPRFYVKTSALSGEVASFKIFEFTEIVPAQPASTTTTQYVTEDVFYKSIEELKRLITQRPHYSKYNKEKDNHA